MTIAKKMIKKLNEVYTSATYLFLLRNGIAVGSKSQSIIRLNDMGKVINRNGVVSVYVTVIVSPDDVDFSKA